MRLELALTALEKKHELVILHEGQKSPVFRNWPERCPDASEVGWQIRKGRNIGIKLPGLVVVDKDAKSGKAWDWMRHRRIHRSPFEVQTRRGVHYFFRLPEVEEEVRARIHHLGLPVDLLTGNRFVVGPGSVVDGFEYTLREGKAICSRDELEEFPIDILQRREEVRASIQGACNLNDERAVKYVDRIPGAESGKGGARQAFVACLKILSLTNGDQERAWQLLLHYNARCVPPWDTEAEEGPDSLRKKLKDAFRVWQSK